MFGHLIYPGCPGVSGWMGCLIPGWRWSHDSCWCYWLRPSLPTSPDFVPPSSEWIQLVTLT